MPTDGATLFRSFSYSLPLSHFRELVACSPTATRTPGRRIRSSGLLGASLSSQRRPASIVMFRLGFHVSCTKKSISGKLPVKLNSVPPGAYWSPAAVDTNPRWTLPTRPSRKLMLDSSVGRSYAVLMLDGIPNVAGSTVLTLVLKSIHGVTL